jgi:hypothetical protein
MSTDSTLAAFSTSNKVSVRALVAANSATSAQVLRTLAGDPDSTVVLAVAGNIGAPPDVLDRLSRSTVPGVALLVGKNPSTPVLALPERSSDVAVRRAVASTLGGIVILAADPNDDVARKARAAALMDLGAIHGRMAGDADPEVRRAIAGSRNAQPQTLIGLIGDDDEGVRAALAGSAVAPPEVFILTSCDPSVSVRLLVASNGRTPRDVLERLAREDASDVRKAASTTLTARTG